VVGAYVDAGVLVKSYVAEANSPAALALLEAEALPLPLTHFQEVEIRNAIRLKVFRREITASNAISSLAVLNEDIRENRLLRPSYSITGVFHRAEELSGLYASNTGARTLDILHVAAALEIGARKFVSLDERQRAVAKKAGLKIAP
jgi:predicted nucleic acid-binding protein